MKLMKLTFAALFCMILSLSTMAIDVDSDSRVDVVENAEVVEVSNSSEGDMTRMGILLGSCLFAAFVIISAKQSKSELVRED